MVTVTHTTSDDNKNEDDDGSVATIQIKEQEKDSPEEPTEESSQKEDAPSTELPSVQVQQSSTPPSTSTSASKPLIMRTRTASPSTAARLLTAPPTLPPTVAASSPNLTLPTNHSFSSRLLKAIKSYNPAKRRPIQSCILYEAERSVRAETSTNYMKHKFALHKRAFEILNSLTWIPQAARDDVMVRTMTKKLLLTPEICYKRLRQVILDVDKKIVPEIMQIYDTNKTHDENCDLYLQKTYEEKSGTNGPKPRHFEYKYDFNFLLYRMFYKGRQVNPDLPLPFAHAYALAANGVIMVNQGNGQPARGAAVSRLPMASTTNHTAATNMMMANHSTMAAAVANAQKHSRTFRNEMSVPVTTRASPDRYPQAAAAIGGDVGAENENDDDDYENSDMGDERSAKRVKTEQELSAEERRALLEEVRGHLEILKQFEGIIPEEDLIARKAELFKVLPKIPDSSNRVVI